MREYDADILIKYFYYFFQAFESKAMALVKKALRSHTKVLSAKHKEMFEEDEQEAVLDDQPMEIDEETNEAALKFALHILRSMNEDEHAHTLERSKRRLHVTL